MRYERLWLAVSIVLVGIFALLGGFFLVLRWWTAPPFHSLFGTLAGFLGFLGVLSFVLALLVLADWASGKIIHRLYPYG